MLGLYPRARYVQGLDSRPPPTASTVDGGRHALPEALDPQDLVAHVSFQYEELPRVYVCFCSPDLSALCSSTRRE